SATSSAVHIGPWRGLPRRVLLAAERPGGGLAPARAGGQTLYPVWPPGAGVPLGTSLPLGGIGRQGLAGEEGRAGAPRRIDDALDVATRAEDELPGAAEELGGGVAGLPGGDVVGRPADDVGVAG